MNVIWEGFSGWNSSKIVTIYINDMHGYFYNPTQWKVIISLVSIRKVFRSDKASKIQSEYFISKVTTTREKKYNKPSL